MEHFYNLTKSKKSALTILYAIALNLMILKNFLWDYSGRLGSMVANLFVAGVLSRILSPDDYGIMGLVMAVTGVASIFQDFGFSSAIVQKNDIDNRQLSTIFFLNWFVGVFIFILIYAIAPWIAIYYKQDILIPILRVSALIFLISPLNLVPSALIQKRMLFKEQAIRNILTTIAIGILSISLALRGWGIWSLVLQSILSTILSLFINLWITKWRPFFFLNIGGISHVFKYSSYLFLSGLINTLYTKIDVFLIGKVFSLGLLGQYTKAQSMDNMVKTISSSSILGVLFPYFSKIQDDELLIKQQWEKYFNLICFIYLLITGLSFIGAKFIFTLLFGEQWNIAADYYKIIALTGAIYPLSALALSILEARGHSKAFFQVEVLKKIIAIPCFFIAYYSGVTWFLISLSIAYVLMFLLNLLFLKKAIFYNATSYLARFFQYTLVTVAFIGIASFLNYEYWINSTNIWVVLFVSILFIVYYWFTIRLLHPHTSQMILETIKTTLKKTT